MRGSRLRLTLESGERGWMADLDGVLSVEARSPRFDGALTLASVAGTSVLGGGAIDAVAIDRQGSRPIPPARGSIRSRPVWAPRRRR